MADLQEVWAFEFGSEMLINASVFVNERLDRRDIKIGWGFIQRIDLSLLILKRI